MRIDGAPDSLCRSANLGQVAIERPDLAGAKPLATDMQRRSAHADRCGMFDCEANGFGRRMKTTRPLRLRPNRVAAEKQISWRV